MPDSNGNGRKSLNWFNRIQWERLDEVLIFIIAVMLIAGLALLDIRYEGNVPGEAWTALGIIIARILNSGPKNTTPPEPLKPPDT